MRWLIGLKHLQDTWQLSKPTIQDSKVILYTLKTPYTHVNIFLIFQDLKNSLLIYKQIIVWQRSNKLNVYYRNRKNEEVNRKGFFTKCFLNAGQAPYQEGASSAW